MTDIKATVVKGKQIYITDGFMSRNYDNDRIITMTVANAMDKQPGRTLGLIKRTLEAEGVYSYINKQQAGNAGSVFIEKKDITADVFSKLFGTDISEWLVS